MTSNAKVVESVNRLKKVLPTILASSIDWFLSQERGAIPLMSIKLWPSGQSLPTPPLPHKVALGLVAKGGNPERWRENAPVFHVNQPLGRDVVRAGVARVAPPLQDNPLVMCVLFEPRAAPLGRLREAEAREEGHPDTRSGHGQLQDREG